MFPFHHNSAIFTKRRDIIVDLMRAKTEGETLTYAQIEASCETCLDNLRGPIQSALKRAERLGCVMGNVVGTGYIRQPADEISKRFRTKDRLSVLRKLRRASARRKAINPDELSPSERPHHEADGLLLGTLSLFTSKRRGDRVRKSIANGDVDAGKGLASMFRF